MAAKLITMAEFFKRLGREELQDKPRLRGTVGTYRQWAEIFCSSLIKKTNKHMGEARRAREKKRKAA